jgi:rubrerythrin
MGTLVDLACADCLLFFKSFHLGWGMLHSASIIFGSFPGTAEDGDRLYSERTSEKPLLNDLVRSRTIREKAFEMLRRGARPLSYNNSLYLCPACKDLFERFYFILEGNGEVYEPQYMCSRCKKPLEPVQIEVEEEGEKIKLLLTEYTLCKLKHEDGYEAEWECPQCGSPHLYYSEVGRWD